MKKNRSNRWTKGITSTLSPSDPLYHHVRFFFFETDSPFNEDNHNMIVRTYEHHNLDLLIHRTGHSGGIHYISPTYVTKEEWKEYHQELKGINMKCPMTTLRWINNKYPNEDSWFTSKHYHFNLEPLNNSPELCYLINHIWDSDFIGLAPPSIIRFVRYPLP